jgi:uncharacterized coiled-coil protein SlyX
MLSKFTKEDVDVKTKEVKKVARQIRQGHQKGENMRNLSQNENYYSQKNNLLPQEEGVTENTVYNSDAFIQQKNAESMYSREAFINLVKRIEDLETEVEIMADMIVDLNDTDKKQKNKIKKQKAQMELLENQIAKRTEQTNTKINTILEIIRNMGIAGGLFDDIYIKKKDLWRETQKQAKRRIRKIRQLSQMGLPVDNGH